MNNNGHHDGGFFNGLIIGLIIGAAVVFLFGTKKGKQILKAINENGLEDLTDLATLLTEDPLGDLEDDIPMPVKTAKSVVTPAHDAEVMEEVPAAAPKKSGPKRFFRGIKR